MTILRARQLLTFAPDRPAVGDDLGWVGLVEDAGVVIKAGRVAWVGAWRDRPDTCAADIEAAVVTPGWVDCHTHAIWAGDRAADFARRNAGCSYADILEAGGGISSTVAASRAADDETLARLLADRLATFDAAGVAAVEVKTGYALDYDNELRHLRVIRDVASRVRTRVVATCLAAHVVPPDARDDRAGYVAMITDRLLPRVAAEGLAEQVDVFADRGAFSVDEAHVVLQAASELGFDLRVHAEELASTGAAALAAALGARSADHLEHVTEADIAALASADVAAVLLPLVTVFLDMGHRPPARALIDAGVRVALSTDLNPGSANSADLQLACSLGCSLLKLSPAEALRAVTRVPAEVLGIDGEYGTVAPGRSGRLVAFDVERWEEIPYHLGGSPPGRRWVE
ncbi:MAG: imidazolonepropionase [Myxococcales bacterium]|nr:imidazolonepropionase [Myxococcales bacterium]MCB9533032.1 imidazolonepropionase [Myxococcales bacterium]